MPGPQKFVVVAVSALSLVACCGLAWWQWQRFESANGTFQNLGYVLQWPLFGIAPAYMFWRFRKLAQQQSAAEAAESAEGAAGGTTTPDAFAPAPRPAAPPSQAPADAAADDDELAVYNRYLASLNAQEPR